MRELLAPRWTFPVDRPATDDPSPTASEETEFSEFYLRHAGDVYAYCWNVLRQRQAAEDAAHQTFLNAWLARGRYHEQGKIRSWLATIARRAAIDMLRKERPTLSLDGLGELPSPASLEEEALQRVDIATLERAITGLSEENRIVVELRRFGLTNEEIARELGLTHDAVKKRQSRAVRDLRRAFADAEAEGGQGGS